MPWVVPLLSEMVHNSNARLPHLGQSGAAEVPRKWFRRTRGQVTDGPVAGEWQVTDWEEQRRNRRRCGAKEVRGDVLAFAAGWTPGQARAFVRRKAACRVFAVRRRGPGS